MANVDIIIRTINQGGGDTRNLVGSLGQLAAKYISVGAVAAGAAKVIKDSIQTTQDYAREVRNLAQVSGTSAVEASKLLQVLDDFELTAQDVTAATRFMTKQGLTPTIDTLAKLSDQYRAIEDPMKRNEFILENLGRGGLKWVNVLNQGGSALQKMSGEINKNLILTDESIRATEEYRLAMDELNDTVMGLKVAYGGSLIKDINAFNWQIEHSKEIIAELTKNGDPLGDMFLRNGQAAAEQAIKLREQKAAVYEARSAMDDYGNALTEVSTVAEMTEEELEALEAQVQAISDKNQSFIGVLDNVSGALETYNEGLAEADAALAAGDMTTEEHAAAVRSLADDYKEASNKIVLSIVQMKLATDGWTNNELAAYLKVGKSLGVFTAAEVKAAGEAVKLADDLVKGVQPIIHIGERAEDAAGGFGIMADSAEALGDRIFDTALPAVGGLKNQINGMPPSGMSWDYFFNVYTTGKVPSLGQSNLASDYRPGSNGPAQWMASGGTLPNKGFAVVGDMPGGGIGPYTEAIINGTVLDAKTTRALKDAGLLDGARSFAGGGYISDAGQLGKYVTAPTTTTRRRASSGTRVGNAASVDGGSVATGSISAAEQVSTVAAAVSEEAVSTASAAVAAVSATQQNAQQQTNQTVSAQQQTSDNIIAAIADLTRAVRKQPTKDDMYQLFHAGQQQSI
jgi:hypothetical protein